MSERQKRDMVNRAIGAVATILGEKVCHWRSPRPAPSDFLPSGQLDSCDI